VSVDRFGGHRIADSRFACKSGFVTREVESSVSVDVAPVVDAAARQQVVDPDGARNVRPGKTWKPHGRDGRLRTAQDTSAASNIEWPIGVANMGCLNFTIAAATSTN